MLSMDEALVDTVTGEPLLSSTEVCEHPLIRSSLWLPNELTLRYLATAIVAAAVTSAVLLRK